MEKVKVCLDCDPGHDDACAIMLAGHNSKIDLLGISTVMGNQTLEKTTANALKIISLAGLRHIDVVAGQGRPLIKNLDICPEIHGDSGLETDKGVFPNVETKEPIQEKGIIHIHKVITQCPEKVTIIATACLTNIALLLILYPEIKLKIEQIVIMGGAMGIGNCGPVMEWNIMVDPHAAKIVFESGLKVVQIPLDVTHTCLVTKDILNHLQSWNTPFSLFLIDLLTFFAKAYKQVYDFDDPPLHDPLAVAYVIEPEIFKTVFMRVDIEINSDLTSGQTVCDVYHKSARPKNIHLATKVDVKMFWKLMLEAWKLSDEKSPYNTQAKLGKDITKLGVVWGGLR